VVAESGGPGGRRYRLDGRYDEQRLVVEIDGHATHATRRQRQADAERDMRLQAQGLRVIRFTYEDVVERPAHVVATIAQFLGLDLAAGA
jgi:very-short-patch-repair endonuclease